MNESITYQQIVEGTTSVFVPQQQTKQKGPGKKQGLPFYNPAMELNRDSSIAVVQWFLNSTDKKQVSLLDGLASTGIRGIRFNHELTGSFDVTINDWSSEAFAVIQKNVKEHHSDQLSCSQEDLNQVLLKQKFDYIDVDPFGSPVLFIDAAMKSIYHKGILAVSATDTAALCGVYPKVCKRRYAAIPYHGSVMHEVGLRILLGFVAREAAKHETGIQPILSYKTDHYMRLYVQVFRNVKNANETANHIQSIPASKVYPFKKEDDQLLGPLWTGQLHSKKIVNQITKIVEKKQFGSKKKMMKLLSIFKEEAEAPLFYFTTDDLGSLLRCSPPKLETLWETFRQEKIPIFRTQFNPTGFKTPALFQQVKKLFISACKTDE
jgi:tRNA (guanine26-N2/guanine27-N2)-dimethyltransferase